MIAALAELVVDLLGPLSPVRLDLADSEPAQARRIERWVQPD